MATIHSIKPTLSWRPEDHSIVMQFSDQKDHIYSRDISSYLLLLIQDLYDNNEQDLAIALQNSRIRLLPNGQAYRRKILVASPCFSETTTTQNTGRSGRAVPLISVSSKESKSKWIDLSLIISLDNGTQICKEKYERIIAALKRVDEARQKPVAKTTKKKPLQIVDAKTLQAIQASIIAEIIEPQHPVSSTPAAVDSPELDLSQSMAAIEPVQTTSEPVTAVSASPEIATISHITDRKEDFESRIVIPDELLNILLYSFKNDPTIEVVDAEKRLYFIPETAVSGILKDGTVYNMSKEFISEKTILGNLPLAFVRRKGSFRTVIRVNRDNYDQKRDTYAESTREQMDLLIAWNDIHIVGDKNLQYIPHSLDDLKIAMQETGAWEDGIRSFYGAVNMGSSHKEPTIRKGYLFTVPSDFDETSYETTRLKGLTDTQLIERIAAISLQLERLKTKNGDDNTLILKHEGDIEAKKAYIQDKNDTISGSEKQFNILKTRAIESLNARENIPADATIESIRESVRLQVQLLQEVHSSLDNINDPSQEQIRITTEIRRTEDEIRMLEDTIASILASIELDDVNFSTLSKEKTLLMKDKQRRRDNLMSSLALLDA